MSNVFTWANNRPHQRAAEERYDAAHPAQPIRILFLGAAQSPLLDGLLEQGEWVMQSDEVITCDQLKAWGITFLISYGYRHIITPDVIEYCQGRAINLHIAYLPWNRGAEPNLWSFIEGTPKGVTIHALDRGVDTGAILCQQQVDFSEQRDWTLATTYQHLHTVLQQLFKQHWPDIKAGRIQGQKQQGKGSYHRVSDFDPFRAQLHSGWDTPIAELTALRQQVQSDQHRQHRVIEQLQARQQRNLSFLRRTDNALYDCIVNYKMSNSKLDVRMEEGEFDLLLGGRSLYHQKAKAYAAQELVQFLECAGPNRPVTTMPPPFPGDFPFPRFFHQRADNMTRLSGITRADYPGHYTMPAHYPCMVFMGCGLGFHIEQFLERFETTAVIVVENDLDRFAASLYCVDWWRIAERFEEVMQKEEGDIGREHKEAEGQLRFRFMVTDHLTEAEQHQQLSTRLHKLAPLFPAMTHFYNHLGDGRNGRVIDKLCYNIAADIATWGNYDDEVNQLNQALYNIQNSGRFLPKSISNSGALPVSIVGAGPSLDETLPLLKQLQSRSFIISCGPALSVLHAEGITPDLHVTLESDYMDVDYLDHLNDPDYLKQICAVGPLHINPVVLSRFKAFRLYKKAESGLVDLFASKGMTLEGGVPTCTNLAFAFSLYYGFKQIRLFGLDFGFVDLHAHHAQETIYYKEDVHQGFSDATEFDHQVVQEDESVTGGVIKTIPIYYASKCHIEALLERYKYCRQGRGLSVINLGEGAKIKHTQWYGPERYASLISAQEDEKKEPSVQGLKQSVIEALFLSSEPVPLTPDDARQCVNDFAGRHAAFCEALLESVGACSFEAISDDDELIQRVSQMMLNMSKRIERLKEEDRALYCFMSGSIKCIGLIGLTHTAAIEVKVHEKRDSHETFRQRQQFIMQWREAYLDICRQWPDHLQRVLAQSEPDARNDWIEKSLFDSE